MENIFKNAQFGKMYKTRNGGKAIYISPSDSYEHETLNSHSCFIQYEGTYDVLEDGRIVNNDLSYGNSGFDIVGEWKKDIDEEKVDNVSGIIHGIFRDILHFEQHHNNSEGITQYIRNKYEKYV